MIQLMRYCNCNDFRWRKGRLKDLGKVTGIEIQLQWKASREVGKGHAISCNFIVAIKCFKYSTLNYD